MNETRTKLEYDGSTYELTNVIKDIFDSSVVWSSTPHQGRTVFGVADREDLADRLLNWLNQKDDLPELFNHMGFTESVLWDAYQAENVYNQGDEGYDNPVYVALEAYEDAAFRWARTDEGMLAILRYDNWSAYIVDLPKFWEDLCDGGGGSLSGIDTYGFLQLMVQRGHVAKDEDGDEETS